MKRLLLSLVSLVLLFGAGLVRAEIRAAPMSPRSQELPTADYGGVDFSTMDATSFVASTIPVTGVLTNTSYTNRQISLYGAFYSTGVCGDAIDVFTSTGEFLNRTYLTSFYNVNGSTGGPSGVLSSGICSGFSGPPKPIKVIGRNVFARNRVSGYIGNLILFWKEAD